jgi:hypothetical protein
MNNRHCDTCAHKLGDGCVVWECEPDPLVPLSEIKRLRNEIAATMPKANTKEQLEGDDIEFNIVCECVADDLRIVDKLISKYEEENK